MLSVLSGRSGLHSPLFTLSLLSFASLGASPGLAQDEPSSTFQEPLQLDDISVTANMVPTERSKVGSAVTSFTEDELEERQTRLVSDVLREVPGVAVSRTGPVGQTTKVRIRGSEANHTLVLIDGIRVNDPSFSGSEFDFAHLLAEEVERVEVLRGPQSALYGSDALGGVINIVTRSGAREPEARLKAEGGSFNTALGHASFSDGGEKYDYIVGGTGFRTKGVSVADERNGHHEADGYENLTGFAKMNLRPVENFEFSFVGRLVDFDSQTDDFNGVAEDGDGSMEGTQVYTRAQGRLSLLDDRWEQTLGLSYVRHRWDILDDGDVIGRYEGETRRIDYQSDFSFETPKVLDASHMVTFAIQHEERAAITESSSSTIERDVSSTGFVGQYQATLFDRLTLTGSLRHDRNEFFEDTNTYRATAVFSIFETGTKLRASYGTGVKNPTPFELYGRTNDYRSNPDLEPEKAKGWDVGIDQSVWGDRAMLNATYFEQRIDNLIQYHDEDWEDEIPPTSINEPGESKIRGVELGLTAEVLENLTARASYTYTHGEDPDGEELIRRPPHLASLNLNYRFLEERANVNLGVIYNGDQKDINAVSLDSYTLVNLAASYRLNESAEVYGRVDNLLDEDYQEVYSYGTPGRAAYAGIRLRF